MSAFSTPAVMLRRVEYGDYDLIITFFSLTRGKIPVIAKSAKKSLKRFAGILELFTVLDLVCSSGRKKGLSILQEAVLRHPHISIREDIHKTAYASYWSDLVYLWMEEGVRQDRLYHLLCHALGELDAGRISADILSIIFQIKFLNLSGHTPDLSRCIPCGTSVDSIEGQAVSFDLKRGGLRCGRCTAGSMGPITLSKGTVKQLQWVERNDLDKAQRVRFTGHAIKESLAFLEAFVPFHLGKEPRSLKFLRQIRA